MRTNLRIHKEDVREAVNAIKLPERITSLGKSWGWFLATGVTYLCLGILAFAWPIHSTIALTYALGLLFVAIGCARLYQTFKLWKIEGRGMRILETVTALVAGFLTLRFPGGGMIAVAIGMTFYFFLNSAVKGIFAFGMRPHQGWGWATLSATASFLLGAYIIVTFPFSALWVPGVILGIDFIVHGASLMGFSFNLRKLHGRIGGVVEPVTERKTAA